MKALLPGLAALALAMTAIAADEPKSTEPEAAVTIVLGAGQATASPWRQGIAHTGGGNIHVTLPAPDTISVTMTGVAVAGRHPFKPSAAGFTFELSQGFEVVFHSPRVKGARLVMWGRTVGLLRSHGHCCKNGGSAEISVPAHARVNCGPQEIMALNLAPRAVAGGENLSVHDREGPVWAPVVPGKYTLHQVFGITAAHGRGLFCQPPAAEFAPEPALEADWISKRDPFHGAAKKDFGFQVIVRVVPEEGNTGALGKP